MCQFSEIKVSNCPWNIPGGTLGVVLKWGCVQHLGCIKKKRSLWNLGLINLIFATNFEIFLKY